MNDQFKPPWNYFPLHVTRIEPFSIALEVGFDQGEQMCFMVCLYDESGRLSCLGPGGESWKELIAPYLEQIAHARWLAEIEAVTGIPRYMRLNDEYRSWDVEWRRHRFVSRDELRVDPACVICGKRTVTLIDDICQDCYKQIFWEGSKALQNG